MNEAEKGKIKKSCKGEVSEEQKTRKQAKTFRQVVEVVLNELEKRITVKEPGVI
jgi:hypothetical protein